MFNDKQSGTTKLRELNKKLIFNCIRENKYISRVELCEKTSISKPTVTRIVGELCKNNIIQELGIQETSIGRKPIMLQVNSNAYYAIGVFLTRRIVHGVVVNITNEVILSQRVDVANITNSEELLNDIAGLISSLIDKIEEKDKILGIGVGVPGLVDYKKGIVLDYGGTEHYKNLNIKNFLEGKFNLDILIDNNANTLVLAEYWCGFGKESHNLTCIICNTGIGAGIIEEGRIMRGVNNFAGEVGHIKIEIDGDLCQCGQRGCIEAYGSTYAVENKAKDIFGKEMKFAEVCEIAELGDERAIQLLKKGEKAIGIGISNMVVTLNPRTIIISGTFFNDNIKCFENVVKIAKDNSYGSEYLDTKYYFRKKSDDINTLGAALLVFETIFKD